MPNFNKEYFTFTTDDVTAYIKEKSDYFAPKAELVATEIGDGNMNYVFRVKDKNSGRSIIIKQAGPVARISDEFKVPTYRNRIESELLTLLHRLSPEFVPAIYFYDPIMNCFVMDDLSDHQILRTALLEHKQFPQFADDISTYLANSLLLTSDIVLDHKEKKELVRRFNNPILDETTEDLVFTEPFYDCPRNDVFDPVLDFVRKEIWADNALKLETAKLKFDFMTHSQSLLHGDLHTGSIFVKQDSTKVFDSEFTLFGPAGFDIGLLVANFIFAYANADATIEDNGGRDDYKKWLTDTITQIVGLFFEKSGRLWNEKANDRVTSYNGFREHYFKGILADTAGYTGCELCRRVIGIAHVKDLTSITDKGNRTRAEKLSLLTGKALILSRESITSGADFVEILHDNEAKL
jgi:5-methylthioribose kinase